MRKDKQPRLILASSSPYRKQILQSAGLVFESYSPDIDETPSDSESACDLVTRLSTSKAQAMADKFTNALVIGSDQVAECGEHILGKPVDRKMAIDQIKRASGSQLILHTGLSLYNTDSKRLQTCVDTYIVNYRNLDINEIEAYIDAEKPFDCCGSLKAEGPGIALLESLIGNDPNTLVGLPLIKLLAFLRNEQYPLAFG